MTQTIRRRDWLSLGATVLVATQLAGCQSAPSTKPEPAPPIVFVHGNGDTAALWMTTIWRFESNGWPRERLHAIDLPYPLARDDDGKAQPGRTSTAEHMAYLAAEVDKVLAATGAERVVLIGNSRGGNAIRNYVGNGGGATRVSAIVLGGVPNHGVWADPAYSPNSEFNGSGPFLSALNAPRADGSEVVAGIRWLTIRSDTNDKFAQPDGIWIGRKGVPTRIGSDGPALKGAENVVIAGIDHRETSFSAQSFAEAYRFLTGHAPATLQISHEFRIVLDGTVSGSGLDNREGNFANNLPLVGARVEVYAVQPESGERRGPAQHVKTIDVDGRWGPFVGDGATHYEFVLSAPGYATTHIYRSPFARSSSVVSLRAERLSETDRNDPGLKALVALSRPRGYFGLPRDRIALDGASPPAGIASGVAGVSLVRTRLADATPRAVVGEFNGERIVGRVWPSSEGQLTLLELTY